MPRLTSWLTGTYVKSLEAPLPLYLSTDTKQIYLLFFLYYASTYTVTNAYNNPSTYSNSNTCTNTYTTTHTFAFLGYFLKEDEKEKKMHFFALWFLVILNSYLYYHKSSSTPTHSHFHLNLTLHFNDPLHFYFFAHSVYLLCTFLCIFAHFFKRQRRKSVNRKPATGKWRFYFI